MLPNEINVNSDLTNAKPSDEHLFTVAICDDDPCHLQEIRTCVDKCLTNVRHRIYCYSQGAELLSELSELRLTLAVIDVQLNGENGISLAQQIQQRQPLCSVIFISSFVTYVQDVYDVDHMAFVLKKDMNIYLPRSISRLLNRMNDDGGHTISVNSDGCWLLIPKSHIVYMERSGRKTAIYVENEKSLSLILTKEKMESLIMRLNDNSFIQCHKSYAFNWRFVSTYEKDFALLNNEVSLPISRKKAPDVLLSFKNWSFVQ